MNIVPATLALALLEVVTQVVAEDAVVQVVAEAVVVVVVAVAPEVAVVEDVGAEVAVVAVDWSF